MEERHKEVTQRINFFKNHNNKLNCFVFPTLRRWTSDKEDYYRRQMSKGFAVVEDGKKIKGARLIYLKFYPRLRDVPDEFLMFDTGKESREEALKFFWDEFQLGPQDPVLALVFGPERKEAQTSLRPEQPVDHASKGK